MTDYTELVKALRICGKGDCVDCDRQRQDKCLKRHWNNENLIDGMLCEAAAAIEELQAEVDEQKQITAHYEQTAKDYWKEACEYHAIVSAKDITAKESEELIRKFKKLPCGPIEPNEPKRGEWVEDTTTYAGPGLSNYKCSLCGKICGTWRMGLKQSELPNWCGNCGADMRVKMEVQE